MFTLTRICILSLFMAASTHAESQPQTETDARASTDCGALQFDNAVMVAAEAERIDSMVQQNRDRYGDNYDVYEAAFPVDDAQLAARIRLAVLIGDETAFTTVLEHLTEGGGEAGPMVSLALIDAFILRTFTDEEPPSDKLVRGAVSKIKELETVDYSLFAKTSLVEELLDVRSLRKATTLYTSGSVTTRFTSSLAAIESARISKDSQLLREAASNLRLLLVETDVLECNQLVAGMALNTVSKQMLYLAEQEMRKSDPDRETARKDVLEANTSVNRARVLIDPIYYPKLWSSSHLLVADVYDQLIAMSPETSPKIRTYRKIRDRARELAFVY